MGCCASLCGATTTAVSAAAADVCSPDEQDELRSVLPSESDGSLAIEAPRLTALRRVAIVVRARLRHGITGDDSDDAAPLPTPVPHPTPMLEGDAITMDMVLLEPYEIDQIAMCVDDTIQAHLRDELERIGARERGGEEGEEAEGFRALGGAPSKYHCVSCDAAVAAATTPSSSSPCCPPSPSGGAPTFADVLDLALLRCCLTRCDSRSGGEELCDLPLGHFTHARAAGTTGRVAAASVAGSRVAEAGGAACGVCRASANGQEDAAMAGSSGSGSGSGSYALSLRLVGLASGTDVALRTPFTIPSSLPLPLRDPQPRSPPTLTAGPHTTTTTATTTTAAAAVGPWQPTPPAAAAGPARQCGGSRSSFGSSALRLTSMALYTSTIQWGHLVSSYRTLARRLRGTSADPLGFVLTPRFVAHGDGRMACRQRQLDAAAAAQYGAARTTRLADALDWV